MFNFTVPKEEASRNCRLLWNKVKAEDARRSKAANKEAPYAPYILHQIKNKRRGGNYEMENFIRILDRGGYQDPLPPQEMSYPKNPPKKDSKGLVDLGRFRSSSGGESTNKQINAAAKSATRLTADLGFKRVLIRSTRLNNDKDRAFEHLTGVKAKKPFWFLHEKIENRATTCEYIESPTTVYPPELDGYKEPIGLEYARQKNLPNINQLLYYYGSNKTIAQPSAAALVPHQPSAAESIFEPNTARKKQTKTARSNKRISGSGGASVWNRKEGNLSRSTLNKMKVLEPLSPIQETHLAHICEYLQRVHSTTIHTIAQYAARMVEFWNAEHFRLLARGEAGLGGVLTSDIATTRVKRMGDLAVASRLGPSSFQAIFPIGPPTAHPYILPAHSDVPMQAPTQGPIAATTYASRSSGGRPKKAQRKAAPLYALTLKEVDGLSNKEVRNYAFQIDKEKPKSFDVCLDKVRKHIRDRNREKTQRNRERRSIKEVPPKST
jgi:hypothetical protein